MLEKLMMTLLIITIALVLRAMLQDCADIWKGEDYGDE